MSESRSLRPTVWQKRVSRRAALRAAALAAAAAALPLASTGTRAASLPESVTGFPGIVRRAGKLTVVQSRDFFQGHNVFIENKIKEYAAQNNIQLEHSYIEAYAGAGNVVQKLTASVMAGDAPDLLTHTLRPAELKFLEILEDTDSLTREIIGQLGGMLPTLQRRSFLDGKYWTVPHFSRAGGWWGRQTPFKEAGIDMFELKEFIPLREALLKASRPDRELWGWGMTANRSGDGETMVRSVVMFWGGQLVDETGEIVVLNKEPYRGYAIEGLNFLKETYTDPKWSAMLPPGVGAWTDPSNNEAYLAGKIFYTNNAGTMVANAVQNNNPVADDTWLLDVPRGPAPGGRSLAGAGDSMNWFIMKGAKNRENAEGLIRYLLSKEVQREMFKLSIGYVYPAYQWGWEEPIFNEGVAQRVTPTWQRVAFDPSGFTSGEWPGPPTAWVASLESSNFWTDMFGEILGGKPVPDALKSAHDRAVRVFKEFGAKGE